MITDFDEAAFWGAPPQPAVTILEGCAYTVLKQLASDSVDTIITSPPYWGLRDYGVEPTPWPECSYSPMAGLPAIIVPAETSCLGLEKTPTAFIAHLVLIFTELRRVLKPAGNCWVNMGDSYAAARGGSHQPAETLAGGSGGKTTAGDKVNRDRHDGYNPSRDAPRFGLKHKDLIGQPWRLAFALQAGGWYLRQDNVWHKPNPMPESVRDRATKSHEYVFHLTKSEKYYFDSAAWAEPATSNPVSVARRSRKDFGTVGTSGIQKTVFGQSGLGENAKCRGETRNRRSVWTVATVPYAEAHYATYPPNLITPPLLASTPPGGIVLDPFGGSGTTAQVALAHGRKAVLIEKGPHNIELIRKRLS